MHAEPRFEPIREYYRRFDEWSRLDTLPGNLEFRRALEVLTSRLGDGTFVLDLGGGPGRYTLELARRGFRVDLVDLSPEHIERAKAEVQRARLEERVGRVEVGNAIRLEGFDDASFDAVLVFGPLYHLVDAGDRRAMASEVARVLRPGGLAFVSFVPRLSQCAWLFERLGTEPDWAAAMARGVHEEGVMHNPRAGQFQEGYYPSSADVERLFREQGFAREAMLSIRGLGYGKEGMLAELCEDALATAWDLVRQTAEEPAIVETCGHAMYVGRRLDVHIPESASAMD